MATCFPEAIPLRKVDFTVTAEALLKVFSAYGIPQVIVHDNGGNFTSQLMTSVLKALGISQISCVPISPTSQQDDRTSQWHPEKGKQGQRGQHGTSGYTSYSMQLNHRSFSNCRHTPYKLLFGRTLNTPISSLREALEGSQENIPWIT